MYYFVRKCKHRFMINLKDKCSLYSRTERSYSSDLFEIQRKIECLQFKHTHSSRQGVAAQVLSVLLDVCKKKRQSKKEVVAINPALRQPQNIRTVKRKRSGSDERRHASGKRASECKTIPNRRLRCACPCLLDDGNVNERHS